MTWPPIANPYYLDDYVCIYNADALEAIKQLPDQSINCVITSPPYWGLRDYGTSGQIGLEQTPEEYVSKLTTLFREIKRVLKDDGTLWLNLGDSYSGSGKGGQSEEEESNNWQPEYTNKGLVPNGCKPKDLIGIPWRVAFALQADGWYLRSDIIWHKPNPMPESVTDRPTKSHEYVFLFSKSVKYYYDYESIKEPALYGWNGSNFDDPRDLEIRPNTGRKPRQSVKRGGFNGKTNDLIGREAFRAITETRNKRSVWTITTKPFTDCAKIVRLRHGASGEPYGDNLRIVSPDCSVHGGLFDLLATLLCGEHADGWLIRNEHSDVHLAHEQHSYFVPIDQLHAYRFGEQSLDYFLRQYEPFASLHNSKNHKMGLALATTLSCTPCVERSDRIGHILAQHGFGGLHLDKLLNNTSLDGMDAHLLGQTLYYNADKSSFSLDTPSGCLCQLYHKKTEKTSHFAVFPEELIIPMVNAGCPAGGTILDPFIGSGTTAYIAKKFNRKCIGTELNPEYCKLIVKRCRQEVLALEGV